MSITLAQASIVVDTALAKGREIGCAPLTVAVTDAGGHLVAFKREDGSGILRFDIAYGKAWGALGMGFGTRELASRAGKQPGLPDGAHRGERRPHCSLARRRADPRRSCVDRCRGHFRRHRRPRRGVRPCRHPGRRARGADRRLRRGGPDTHSRTLSRRRRGRSPGASFSTAPSTRAGRLHADV